MLHEQVLERLVLIKYPRPICATTLGPAVIPQRRHGQSYVSTASEKVGILRMIPILGLAYAQPLLRIAADRCYSLTEISFSKSEFSLNSDGFQTKFLKFV